MSGLCGWIGRSAAVADNLRLVRRMAGPLARFDGGGIHALAGENSALAVAASGDSAHIYQKEGLLVALWGRAGFSEPSLSRLARAEGMAKTLADSWRARGEKAFASLTGAFSLCILHEERDEAVLAIDRMGIRPLSFQISGESLVFGSSADAINLHAHYKARK